MKVSETNLAEVKLINFFNHTDHRGNFVKTFHDTNLKNAGIDFETDVRSVDIRSLGLDISAIFSQYFFVEPSCA